MSASGSSTTRREYKGPEDDSKRIPFTGTSRTLATSALSEAGDVEADDVEEAKEAELESEPETEAVAEGQPLIYSFGAPFRMLETIYNTWKEKTPVYSMQALQSFKPKWAKIIFGIPVALLTAISCSAVGVVALAGSATLSVAAVGVYFFASIKPFTAPLATFENIFNIWKEQTPLNAMLAYEAFNAPKVKNVFGVLTAIVTGLISTAIALSALAISAFLTVVALPLTLTTGWLTWDTKNDDTEIAASPEEDKADLRKIIGWMTAINTIFSLITFSLPASGSAVITLFSSTFSFFLPSIATIISQSSVGSAILWGWSTISSAFHFAGSYFLAFTPFISAAWAPPVIMLLGTLMIGYSSYKFITELAPRMTSFINASLKTYFGYQSTADDSRRKTPAPPKPSVTPSALESPRETESKTHPKVTASPLESPSDSKELKRSPKAIMASAALSTTPDAVVVPTATDTPDAAAIKVNPPVTTTPSAVAVTPPVAEGKVNPAIAVPPAPVPATPATEKKADPAVAVPSVPVTVTPTATLPPVKVTPIAVPTTATASTPAAKDVKWTRPRPGVASTQELLTRGTDTPPPSVNPAATAAASKTPSVATAPAATTRSASQTAHTNTKPKVSAATTPPPYPEEYDEESGSSATPFLSQPTRMPSRPYTHSQWPAHMRPLQSQPPAQPFGYPQPLTQGYQYPASSGMASGLTMQDPNERMMIEQERRQLAQQKNEQEREKQKLFLAAKELERQQKEVAFRRDIATMRATPLTSLSSSIRDDNDDDASPSSTRRRSPSLGRSSADMLNALGGRVAPRATTSASAATVVPTAATSSAVPKRKKLKAKARKGTTFVANVSSVPAATRKNNR